MLTFFLNLSKTALNRKERKNELLEFYKIGIQFAQDLQAWKACVVSLRLHKQLASVRAFKIKIVLFI